MKKYLTIFRDRVASPIPHVLLHGLQLPHSLTRQFRGPPGKFYEKRHFSEFSGFQPFAIKNNFMISFSPLHAMSVHHGICPIMNDIKYVVVNLQKSVFQIEMNL